MITPLSVLEYTDTLVQGDTPGGDPTRHRRHDHAARPRRRRARQRGGGGRQADSARTLERAGAIPAEERTLDNPDWIDFLLFDNTGRDPPLAADVPQRPTHASIVVRLPGNLSIDEEGGLAVDRDGAR